MPANLILNGERLPIGTSDLNGDISEEDEFGPPQAPQWSDADWDAYQASLQDYDADEDGPWDNEHRHPRRTRDRRELSMPATPSADGNLSGDTLLSLCINSKLLGLGVIPEKFIRQIYLKSLPPQWNSFKLKQSGENIT